MKKWEEMGTVLFFITELNWLLKNRPSPFSQRVDKDSSKQTL